MTKIVNKVTRKKITEPKDKIKYPIFYPENSETLREELSLEDGIECNIRIEISEKVEGCFSFHCNDLPNCCAIYELGSIACDKNLTPEVINTCLNMALDSVSNLADKKDMSKTIIINTNGILDCIPIEKALAVNNNFTLVKTFKNTTGSTIKMWVSRN